jgi:hypothetical protein
LIIPAIVARRFLFVATSLTALMNVMFCATARLAAATGLASGRTAAAV